MLQLSLIQNIAYEVIFGALVVVGYLFRNVEVGVRKHFVGELIFRLGAMRRNFKEIITCKDVYDWGLS